MENTSPNNVILGSGIAGISAGYHLKKKGVRSIIFEKDNDWGGLCGYFTIDGFRFDRFVHFTFASDVSTRELFELSSPTFAHPSLSQNYYHGYWLKHPAQNNLAPLSAEEKTEIIADFVNRPHKEVSEIKTYDEWLRVQYGHYFAEHFPFVYTRKYWGVEAKELETKWVGQRMYTPDLKQVLKGSYEVQEDNFYYTKFMNYPKKGGYRSLLNTCREGLDIRFNKKVVRIAPEEKTVHFADGSSVSYERLISTLPLPEIVTMIDECPEDVVAAAGRLHWTKGYQVSLGFRRSDIAQHLWFYIYDEDILAARVYSPNLKSPDNVPSGCSSLQAEVFVDCKADLPQAETVLQNTVKHLKKLCSFCDEDLVVQDIRFEPYANVTFTPNTYDDRQIILDWLASLGIESIGRFGKWDYLWSHQAFESGKII
jgi:protoporphyrinogen oxidase